VWCFGCFSILIRGIGSAVQTLQQRVG
jgi:hypothetical protein